MTGVYVGLGAVALALAGAIALALAFALALARTASRSDETSERLLVEYLRESARVLESLVSGAAEARRAQASEVAGRLSHRRTSRQPSSA